MIIFKRKIHKAFVNCNNPKILAALCWDYPDISVYNTNVIKSNSEVTVFGMAKTRLQTRCHPQTVGRPFVGLLEPKTKIF